jgi:putative acetyltransferase
LNFNKIIILINDKNKGKSVSSSQKNTIIYYPAQNRAKDLIEELLGVWLASVSQSHHFLQESDILALTPQVRSALANSPDLAVIQDAQDQSVGFLLQEDQKIEALFLAPQVWGQGMGRQLVEWAVERGARLVDVNVDNPQAGRFYLHLGFEIFAESQFDGQGRPFPLYHMELKGPR